MQKYAKKHMQKYAKNIQNMQKICNMQNICKKYAAGLTNMHQVHYAEYVQKICKKYAIYANHATKICTSDFADGDLAALGPANY